jgi:alkylation response protein AidB-like acyl-CoA dehydrogenase
MQTGVEAARALTWRAARLKQAGQPHSVEGAQAKMLASRTAREVTGEAIQVLGGYGYTKEFATERYYRDAKVTEIYEGTSEIQRLVIARGLLGEAAREPAAIAA